MRMRPGLSLTKILLSGAKSIAHGVSKPRTRISMLKSGVAPRSESREPAQIKNARTDNSRSALVAIWIVLEAAAALTTVRARELIRRRRDRAAGRLRGFRSSQRG